MKRLPKVLQQFAQATWEDELDFSGGRQRVAWWAWLLMGVGAMALVVSNDHLDAIRAEQDEVQAQEKRLMRADRQMRLARALQHQAQLQADNDQPSSHANEQGPPPLAGAALLEAAHMARLLAYPWLDTLTRIDEVSAAHRVVLSSLAMNLETQGRKQPGSEWRLGAMVPHDAAALAWARSLPEGQILSRERAAQPFTSTWGNYGLKVDAQMRTAINMAWPVLATPSKGKQP